MALVHEKLIAWQRADDLFVALHTLTREFPPEERYGLTGQMRRAAYSVAANIVEGMARRSQRDRLRFLNIAEASLAEVGYGLHVLKRLGLVNDETYARFDTAIRQVGAPLAGLIRSLNRVVPPRETPTRPT